MRLDSARRRRVHGTSLGVDCLARVRVVRAHCRGAHWSFLSCRPFFSCTISSDQLPIRDLCRFLGEPEIRKAIGQVSVSPKPRLPANPRSRAHLPTEAYPRSLYALHTCIHLSLDPLPPERDSNDSLDTPTAPRRMDGSMLRRGDENRAVTPGKAMRAVRRPPSRFRERVSTHVCS